MSLDVYLKGDPIEVECFCGECGNKHTRIVEESFYSGNITHNLGNMAKEAGIDKHLWRPEEIGVVFAKELIAPLQNGLLKLKDNPEYYKQFDAENGWGVYKDFVPFVEEYLNACIEYPDAKVEASR